MHAEVWDADDTSGDDILQQGSWGGMRYSDGMYSLDQMDSGIRTTARTALVTEEGPVGLCTTDQVTVCQQITVTPIPVGQ